MSNINAIVIRQRGVNHGGEHLASGTVVRDMDAGQFGDWKSAGIVREATAGELSGSAPVRRARRTRVNVPRAKSARAKPAKTDSAAMSATAP